ncbi:MAG: nucleotidyltransferase domain-containing protein [candidate division KSB1 bacterium]|nr:nucleotidyltransferase domain-containing protein [candidate division KSB1 bacterium]
MAILKRNCVNGAAIELLNAILNDKKIMKKVQSDKTAMNPQFETIKTIFLQKFRAQAIYIFGSAADGTDGNGSDIDICVVLDLKGHRKIEVMRAIRRALARSIELPLDILVYSEDEFESRAKIRNTLEHEIAEKGLKLYG